MDTLSRDVFNYFLEHLPNVSILALAGTSRFLRAHIKRLKPNFSINVDVSLKDECLQGNMSTALWLISKGATDWNNGLYEACRGGHLQLANLMIEQGATDWDGGLRGACWGGHLPLVNLMIERGATNLTQYHQYFG